MVHLVGVAEVLGEILKEVLAAVPLTLILVLILTLTLSLTLMLILILILILTLTLCKGASLRSIIFL